MIINDELLAGYSVPFAFDRIARPVAVARRNDAADRALPALKASALRHLVKPRGQYPSQAVGRHESLAFVSARFLRRMFL
jgi:hypothetical protein